MARNLGALARLACSGSIAAMFLNGWPHEMLGDEPSHCLNPGVAEGMQGVEYLTAEGRWDVQLWFATGSVTVQLDCGARDEDFFKL